MAFLQVQNKTQTTNGATTNVLTPTNSLTVNNLVVIGVKCNPATGNTILSVTDNASIPNTYVLVGPFLTAGGGANVYLVYGVQVTGGATTITITFNGSINSRSTLGEYSGGQTSNAAVFDKSSKNEQQPANASHSAPSFTPSMDGELIVAIDTNDSGLSTYTAGTNYTLGGNTAIVAQEYRLASVGAETAPLTYVSGLGTWCEIAAAFIASGMTTTSTSTSTSTSTTTTSTSTTTTSTSTTTTSTSSSTSTSTTTTYPLGFTIDDQDMGTDNLSGSSDLGMY